MSRIIILRDGSRVPESDWWMGIMDRAMTDGTSWQALAQTVLNTDFLAIEEDGSIRCSVATRNGDSGFCMRRVKVAGQRCPSHLDPLAKVVTKAVRLHGKPR